MRITKKNWSHRGKRDLTRAWRGLFADGYDIFLYVRMYYVQIEHGECGGESKREVLVVVLVVVVVEVEFVAGGCPPGGRGGILYSHFIKYSREEYY